MKFLAELAARRRFGMRPGLETIRALCAALGNPQEAFRAIHVAGTNGKGAVSAMLDAALRDGGFRVGRYTSPHLVRLNERFFLDGRPVDDAALDRLAETVERSVLRLRLDAAPTFFEALTAVAYLLYAEAKVDWAVLECGLGGRLDATNVCRPSLCVITKIGLDHCDWLGDTVEKIAAEKAGIVKPGVPVVLARNADSVREVVAARAKELDAPFFYAPDLADESEIPADFALVGAFNRENAVTALAALKVFSGGHAVPAAQLAGFAKVVWPGRFQRIGSAIVDGAHNPPAARALAGALASIGVRPKSLNLVCGFCGDKDVGEVLAILAPLVRRGAAVRTNNPRSLSPEETAEKMCAAGIPAKPQASLREALSTLSSQPPTLNSQPSTLNSQPTTLVCGSLFLAGEALVALGAYPWGEARFDLAELLKV